jgi:hypothetical protein
MDAVSVRYLSFNHFISKILNGLRLNLVLRGIHQELWKELMLSEVSL